MAEERLRKENIEPWQALERKGVGVHVGEWGAFNHTPHKVVLAWMRDYLALWKDAGWGWALWELRGGFGVLDSQRADVEYESFRGHKLDRQMLDLLRNG
jgi:endoglucanase